MIMFQSVLLAYQLPHVTPAMQDELDVADPPTSSGPAKGGTFAALSRAGVTDLLAREIAQPVDLRKPRSRQRCLVAWGLLLSHILALPEGSSGRPFLAQALKEEYG